MSISEFLKNAIATKVARWQTDASGNVLGLVGPDGREYALLSKHMVSVDPSGDTTGVTDTQTIQALLDDVGGGSHIYLQAGIYYTNVGLAMKTGKHLIMASGSELRLVHHLERSCTATSGSAVLAVSDTTGLSVGMYVYDTGSIPDSANPTGAFAMACKIASIGVGQVVLTANATASGSVQTRFTNVTNTITASGVDDWSVTCLDGYAIIDANKDYEYPYPVGDACHNAIRVLNCNNYELHGLILQNGYFHGLIAVNRMVNIRIDKCVGRWNGFRSFHIHGDAADEYRNVYIGHLQSIYNGQRCLYRIGGSQNNTGVYAVFESGRQINIQSIYSEDEAWACTLTGELSGAQYAAECAHVGSIITKNSGGVALHQSIKNVKIDTVIVKSDHAQITGCQFVDAVDTAGYYVTETNVVSPMARRNILMPSGAAAAAGIRPGYYLFATDGTNCRTDVRVWSISYGTGAGGTDVITVFAEESPTTSPYTGTSANATVQYYAMRIGIQFFAEASRPIKNVVIGSAFVEGAARSPFVSYGSSSEYRYTDIAIDNLYAYKCGGDVSVTAVNGLKIGNLVVDSIGLPKTDNTAGGAGPAGGNVYLTNCANFDISLTRRHTSVWSQNARAVYADSNCRAGTIKLRVSPVVGAGYEIGNIATPAGAGANALGVSGPIVIDNPRTINGAQIAMATSATENAITRTNANACIRVVPTDTP